LKTKCYAKRKNTIRDDDKDITSALYNIQGRRGTKLLHFDEVNLQAPFALYVVAAIAALGMMGCSVVESFSGEKKGRGSRVRIVGLVFALVSQDELSK
jgi:hypothetical protein